MRPTPSEQGEEVKLLPIGTQVIASCPFWRIFDEPGIVDGYVRKDIYPTGHGEYSIKFDEPSLGCKGCDAKHVQEAGDRVKIEVIK